MSCSDQADEAFWSLVDQSGGPGECWPWLGSRVPKDGRGTYWIGGRNVVASRYALTLAVGDPPTPKHLACHQCDNPPCCNPDHLWWGTCAENLQDASAKKRLRNNLAAHCPKGHPLSGDNLRIVKGNQRRCHRCTLDYQNRRRAVLLSAGKPSSEVFGYVRKS